MSANIHQTTAASTTATADPAATTKAAEAAEAAGPETTAVSTGITADGRVHVDAVLENGRPDPKWVRGKCPDCGDDLVSNLYYVGGKGYLIVWECWATLSENPTCSYRRVL